MNSIKNLTRLNFDTAGFQGWRLSIGRAGTVFTKYYSDKKYGDEKKSLAAAEASLVGLKEILEGAKLIKGKHTATTIRRAEKLLEQA